MSRYIIGNIVAPPEERDVYNEMGLASGFKGYVKPDQAEEPEVGESSSYVQELTDEQVEEIKEKAKSGEVSNLRYIEEDAVITTDELEVEEVEEDADPGNVPEPASLQSMGADGLTESGWDGTGVTVCVLDGGTSRKFREVTGFNPALTYDFVSDRTATHLQVEAGGTEHGCFVAPHALPPNSRYIEGCVFNAEGSAYWSNVARSFRWAADRGAHVVNFSGSGSGISQTIQDAVNYGNSKGTVYVCSMGNDGQYTFNATPAGLNYVVSSIALDKSTGRRATFSNYHEKASGTSPGHRELSYNKNGQLIRWSGTSASSPNKAGIIAMGATKGSKPGYKATEVALALKSTAVDTPDVPSEEGAGKWFLRNALKKLEADNPVSEPEPTPTPEPAPTPEPTPPPEEGFYPNLPRHSYNYWEKLTNTQKKALGDCVLTEGRDKVDSCVVLFKKG